VGFLGETKTVPQVVWAGADVFVEPCSVSGLAANRAVPYRFWMSMGTFAVRDECLAGEQGKVLG